MKAIRNMGTSGLDAIAKKLARDIFSNAAINLKNYAASSTVSACGGEGAGLGGDAKAKPAPMKQEVSFVPV